MSATIDMTGWKSPTIRVLRRAGSCYYGRHAPLKSTAKWQALCLRCGTKFFVDGCSLRKGLTKSCGCLRAEKARARCVIKHKPVVSLSNQRP